MLDVHGRAHQQRSRTRIVIWLIVTAALWLVTGAPTAGAHKGAPGSPGASGHAARGHNRGGNGHGHAYGHAKPPRRGSSPGPKGPPPAPRSHSRGHGKGHGRAASAPPGLARSQPTHSS